MSDEQLDALIEFYSSDIGDSILKTEEEMHGKYRSIIEEEFRAENSAPGAGDRIVRFTTDKKEDDT